MTPARLFLFAYGEMGDSVLYAFLRDRRFQVVGVVVPPQGVGLYRAASPLPVEVTASAHHLPILASDTMEEIVDFASRCHPDIGVIATFNKLLPASLLTSFPILNVHHGLLPRHRGRASINWAILRGMGETGVTIHETLSGLDSGDIYFQQPIAIPEDATVKEVYESVCRLLSVVLPDLTFRVLKKRVNGLPQDERNATYCCTRLPSDGWIEWSCPAVQIYNLIRALTRPYPGAWTVWNDQRIILWSATLRPNARYYEGSVPGRCVACIPGCGVEVLTGYGVLFVQEVEVGGVRQNASFWLTSTKETLGWSAGVMAEKILSIRTGGL